MIRQCINDGLRAGRGNSRLIALLWLWNLTLAFLGVLPAWIWLGSAVEFAPESDRLLTGFNFSLFSELGQYDRSPIRAVAMAAIFGVALLALLTNPLVSGGLLETLLTRDDSKTLVRFFRGAGRFFWRYLRLTIYAVVSSAVVFGIEIPIFAPIAKRAGDSAWELAPFVAGLFQGGLLLLMGAYFSMALDYARIRTARDDSRRALRIWFGSLRFVLIHPLAAFGILITTVFLYAVTIALYAGIRGLLPLNLGFAIALVIILQQIVMFIRTQLRVALIAGEIAFYDRALPPVAQSAPVEAPPLDLQ